MPPASIPLKYAKLFADETMIRRYLKGPSGTINADIAAIRAALAAKLADKRFMEGLINEYVARGAINIRMK